MSKTLSREGIEDYRKISSSIAHAKLWVWNELRGFRKNQKILWTHNIYLQNLHEHFHGDVTRLYEYLFWREIKNGTVKDPDPEPRCAVGLHYGR